MPGKNGIINGNYMLGHSFRESDRLYVQHWIFNMELGYLLNPVIPKTTPDLKVLDVGAGNALWLLELSKSVPRSWQLEGIDKATDNFPAAEYLPENVHLRSVDLLSDKDTENMVGAYDVVHVRAFAVVIHSGDPKRFIDALIRVCKPGGYIQWEDLHCGTFKAYQPNLKVSNQSSEEVLRLWHIFVKKIDIDFEYLFHLPQHMEKHDLQVLDSFRLPPSNLVRKASADNFLNGIHAFGENASLRDRNSFIEGGLDALEALYTKVFEEARKGVCFGIDMVGVVARKPLKIDVVANGHKKSA